MISEEIEVLTSLKFAYLKWSLATISYFLPNLMYQFSVLTDKIKKNEVPISRKWQKCHLETHLGLLIYFILGAHFDF